MTAKLTATITVVNTRKQTLFDLLERITLAVHAHMFVNASRSHVTMSEDLYLHDCHWTVLRFSRRALLTSDQPVVMMVKSDYPEWQGVGIATADAFLAPLSRRVGLIIQPRHKLPLEDRSVPDLDKPGTTKLARMVNQEVARQALRVLYHHPDDSLLDDLYLPPPDQPQLDGTTGDNLISENGLFHGLSPDQLKAFSRATSPHEQSKGMSIRDLTWPIPGRITSQRPTHW